MTPETLNTAYKKAVFTFKNLFIDSKGHPHILVVPFSYNKDQRDMLFQRETVDVIIFTNRKGCSVCFREAVPQEEIEKVLFHAQEHGWKRKKKSFFKKGPTELSIGELLTVTSLTLHAAKMPFLLKPFSKKKAEKLAKNNWYAEGVIHLYEGQLTLAFFDEEKIVEDFSTIFNQETEKRWRVKNIPPHKNNGERKLFIYEINLCNLETQELHNIISHVNTLLPPRNQLHI